MVNEHFNELLRFDVYYDDLEEYGKQTLRISGFDAKSLTDRWS